MDPLGLASFNSGPPTAAALVLGVLAGFGLLWAMLRQGTYRGTILLGAVGGGMIGFCVFSTGDGDLTFLSAIAAGILGVPIGAFVGSIVGAVRHGLDSAGEGD